MARDFAAAIADLAMMMQTGDAELDMMEIIVQGAVDIVPGAQSAAIGILDGDAQVKSIAGCGRLSAEALALQNRLGEGPSRHVMLEGGQIRIGELSADDRWPRFAAQAGLLGIGSMICTPLLFGSREYGSLTLSSAQPHGLSQEAEPLATAFAIHAAIALRDGEQRRNLRTAIDTRDVIGQAKGILMERLRLTPEAAFAVLVATSQQTNQKLHSVAEQLSLTGELAVTDPRAACT